MGTEFVRLVREVGVSLPSHVCALSIWFGYLSYVVRFFVY